MDRSNSRASNRGVSPAVPGSRLPTKRNSVLSLRPSRESLGANAANTTTHPAVPPSPSPSAVSDTSTNGSDAFPGARNGFGFAATSASRRSSSSSQQSDSRGRLSTSATRIPRLSPAAQESRRIATVGLPSPTPRRPISIKDAFQMAQRDESLPRAPAASTTPAGNLAGAAQASSGDDSTMDMTVAEAAAQGSPSPAPRPWRNRPGSSGSAAAARGTPTPAASSSHQNATSTNGNTNAAGLFAPRARVSPKIAVAGRELHRRASNSSLGEKSKVPVPVVSVAAATTPTRASLPSWGGHAKPGSAARRLSMQPATQLQPQTQSQAPQAPRSPEKSFAWDAEADFTAGDLMVSASPPVHNVEGGGEEGLGIRDQEQTQKEEQTQQEQPPTRTQSQPQKQRTDALERLDEAEAEHHHGREPDEVLPPAPTPDHERRHRTGWKGFARTNTAIDEIRAREAQPLSKAALSQARLEGIRQMNAEWVAPARMTEETGVNGASEPDKAAVAEAKTADNDGEHVPNTPVTVFRSASRERGRLRAPVTEDNNHQGGRRTGGDSVSPGAHARRESQELLRKLARVTTSVAAATAAAQQQHGKDGLFAEGRTLRIPRAREADTLRPTVGFASLRRMTSNESMSTKRSSAVQSDGDPIDRIEAEMNLFAPAENHSERGSIRAPSPEEESDEDEEEKTNSNPAEEATPRAQKIMDPLLQPTPRVTGAYVETPMTERVEMVEVSMEKTEKTEKTQPAIGSTVEKTVPTQPSTGRAPARPQSQSRSRPRSRTRADAPPVVVNSAKVATAREDLLALQQHAGPVEDATLENFAAMLAGGPVEGGKKDDKEDKDNKDSKEDVAPARLRRMSQTIRSTLLDMKQAKRNIERMEDNVAYAQPAGDEQLSLEKANGKVKFEGGEEARVKIEVKAAPKTNDVDAVTPRRRKTKQSAAAMVAAAATALETKETKQTKPTRSWWRFWRWLLSWLLLIGIVFAIAEGAACAKYCRPTVCDRGGAACAWSPADPMPGQALAVTADRWLTGGRGRVLWARAWEALGDAAADVRDAVTGTDLRQVDATYFSFDEKRRHRRRLQKRGLAAPWTPAPEVVPQLEIWRRAREAGGGVDSSEDDAASAYGAGQSMAADERVGDGWW